MNLKRSELEQLVRESVEEELTSLNEDELNELFGGLGAVAQKVGGAVGGAVKGAAGAVGGAVKGAVGAVGGAVKGAASAVGGAVKGAAGDLKTAYQSGEAKAAMQDVSKSIQNTIGTVNKSLQTVAKSDPNLKFQLDNVLANLQTTADALRENANGKRTPKEKQWVRKQK